MKTGNSFKVAALAAAVALAMGSTAVMAAAPAATQLPGQGKVLSTGTAPVATITADTNTLGIVLNSATVIDWNKGTTVSDINPNGVAGFNIGADATVNFTGSFGVLNLDSTGNPSQIFGALTGEGNVFVANSNGIIVGAGASISSGATVGLIGNALSPTAAADFAGGFASIGFNGTGGDVTVLPGAIISGANKVFISGGGTVNVDLAGVTGSNEVNLSAGLPQAGGAFAGTNPGALLAVSNSAGTTDTPTSFASAGDASSSGALELGSTAAVAGTFTNNGVLTLDGGFAIDGALVNNKTVTTQTGYPGGTVSAGSLTNNGTFDGDYYLALATTNGGVNNSGIMRINGLSVDGGDFVNSGEFHTAGSDVNVTDGNVVNSGIVDGASTFYVLGGNVTNNAGASMEVYQLSVTNGSIANAGTLITNWGGFWTASDSTDASFTKGADYSITNTGTIVDGAGDGDDLEITANDQYNQDDGTLNGSTGSFTNTGLLQMAKGGSLYVSANNDISLGGQLQTIDGDGVVEAVSAANPLTGLDLEAGNYDYDYTFTSDGVVTVSTPVTVSPYYSEGVFVAGTQVKLMNDISVVDGNGDPSGTVDIVAGAQSTDYAVRVASGKTISAGMININGDVAGNNPNVILQGTLSANMVNLGQEGYYYGVENVPEGAPSGLFGVSDVFSGPTGGIVATGDESSVNITFTGLIKTAPYLNDVNNFRYNYLPITVADGGETYLTLNPVAYQTNGTSNGLSAVNILVNGSAYLETQSAPAEALQPTAVTGVVNWPNTHLVLQSTGNITTGINGGQDDYWPGYVYLGTIDSDANGAALPGTLGLGQITLGGNLNNVLPGSVDIGAGIHFMTAFPLIMNNFTVTTNANAWVNFATPALTDAYARGVLGSDLFFGGVQQGTGLVVNYGALDPSMFHTHLPDDKR